MAVTIPNFDERVAIGDRSLILLAREAYITEIDVLEKREHALRYAYVLWEFRHGAMHIDESREIASVLRSLGEEFAKPVSTLFCSASAAPEVAQRAYRIASGLLWQTRGNVQTKYERHRSLAVVDSLIRWGLPHAETAVLSRRYRELWAEWSIVLGDCDRARQIVSSIEKDKDICA